MPLRTDPALSEIGRHIVIVRQLHLDICTSWNNCMLVMTSPGKICRQRTSAVLFAMHLPTSYIFIV